MPTLISADRRTACLCRGPFTQLDLPPFHSTPHEPERVTSPRQAQADVATQHSTSGMVARSTAACEHGAYAGAMDHQ
jgi:hypothetical protein